MNHLSTRRQIEGTLPTVAEMLRLKGEVDALRILTLADIELTETSFDNWNGGTEIWTAYFRVPVSEFVRLRTKGNSLLRFLTTTSQLYLERTLVSG